MDMSLTSLIYCAVQDPNIVLSNYQLDSRQTVFCHSSGEVTELDQICLTR
ncbi:hypothetical protein NSND_50579 [Nitrospira sp. ND1]|nr:hypothetical protein NSND_50579 [Nitrospira sp. ND1]